MAKKKKTRERKTPFKASRPRFGELRKQQRALTISVKYWIQYRDPLTGAFASFKPGKSNRPVLFQRIERFDDPSRRTKTVKTGRAKVGGDVVVLPATRRKTKFGPADIVKIVNKRIAKRKTAKARLVETKRGAEFGYPSRVQPKATAPKKPKGLRKGGGRTARGMKK